MNNDSVIEIIRGLTEGGKVKTKGAYEVMHFEKLGFHKNHSAMVIPMAVLAHILELKNYKDFILDHDDPFDFCLRTKVPRSSSLVMVMEDGTEIEQQNICRYYPAHSGGKLVKLMPPLKGKEAEGFRRLGIDTDWNVLTCNDMSQFKWDVNYDYYIQEAQALIDAVTTDAMMVSPF